MNKLEFLKSIANEGKIKAGQNDQLNSEELLNLQKDGLIEITYVLSDDASCYHVSEYWITDKGKQFIKDHSFVALKKVANKLILPIFIIVMGAVILHLLKIK